MKPALQRDQGSAARDRQADERDVRAGDRMQAAVQYSMLTRRLLDAVRGQAAIERAQQSAESAPRDHVRWTELSARAHAACVLAEALCENAQESQRAAPPQRDVLRRSELARLRARLDTLPVIEQAKACRQVTPAGPGESQ